MNGLLKEINWKNFLPQHWRIIKRVPDEVNDTMTVIMGLWKNKTSANNEPTYLDWCLQQYTIKFEGSDKTRAECLARLKLPIYQTQPDPNNPGQTIEVDINPLTGAVDDN